MHTLTTSECLVWLSIEFWRRQNYKITPISVDKKTMALSIVLEVKLLRRSKAKKKFCDVNNSAITRHLVNILYIFLKWKIPSTSAILIVNKQLNKCY